jgi:hypothetical protein
MRMRLVVHMNGCGRRGPNMSYIEQTPKTPEGYKELGPIAEYPVPGCVIYIEYGMD